MAKRVIQDASFRYLGADGFYVMAFRGETHDIPEGEDLARGDKFGAFTRNGKEPLPPEGSFIPEIDVDWSDQEFENFVDAGTIAEIIERLAGVEDGEQRQRVAERLIQAEASRGERKREPLLQHLNAIAGIEPVLVGESGPEITEVGSGSEIEPNDPDLEVVETPESLAEFVESNKIDAVLAKAGDDPETAKALRLAEEARGDKARSSLIDALSKLEDDEA